MNSRSSYSQKLLDPRWQKKRLEVMQAHNFACEICCDNQSTLHIHHKQYLKGNEPWDYLVNQLACLCESCHENYHNEIDILMAACSILPLHGLKQRDNVAYFIAGLMDRNLLDHATEDQKKLCLIGQKLSRIGLNNFLRLLMDDKNG